MSKAGVSLYFPSEDEKDAMVTGTYAVAAQASEDWKQGEGDPLGDAITETLAKTIGGAIEGGICALAGPMNWGEEAKELLGW